MKVSVHHSGVAYDTYRYNRAVSLFNVDHGPRFDAEFDVPVEEKDWRVGLVVGPSGSGKSSIGRALYEAGWAPAGARPWDPDKCVLDAVAPRADFDAVTAAFASVGLGDVPAWLRAHRVLSNGEQFRAELARLLVEGGDRVVFDEFTSVVDRQVATVGAAAFAKAWRRRPVGQVVLLTCHYDVADWLEPDWIVDTGARETWLPVGEKVGELSVPGGKDRVYAPLR